MKVLSAFAITILLATAAQAAPSCLENAKCTFVDEYIRELAALNEIMLRSQKEMAQVDPKSNQLFAIAIHDSERQIYALKANVAVLKSQPENGATKQLIASYELLIDLNTRISDIATSMLAGPKPGVDYGSVMAQLPKIRAAIDDTTGDFPLMSNLVFGQLFALGKQDKKGHVELAITTSQRNELIDHINTSFGDVLNHLKNKDASWTVGSISVLRTQLLKKFTTADDPIA